MKTFIKYYNCYLLVMFQRISYLTGDHLIGRFQLIAYPRASDISDLTMKRTYAEFLLPCILHDHIRYHAECLSKQFSLWLVSGAYFRFGYLRLDRWQCCIFVLTTRLTYVWSCAYQRRCSDSTFWNNTCNRNSGQESALLQPLWSFRKNNSHCWVLTLQRYGVPRNS